MTDDGRSPDAEPDPDEANHPVNLAAGGAQVGMQVGSIDSYFGQAGVVHIHHAGYRAGEGDSPKHRFAVAKRLLAIGARTEAEKLTRGLVAADEGSAEVAYYWALAVVDGRPFEHLVAEDFRSLDHAWTVADKDEHGAEWRDALAVVRRLLDHLAVQSEHGARPDRAQVDDWFAALGTLPPERRGEIRHHLREVLDNADRDRADAERTERIRAHRMDDGRRRRVPKFFEPDPVEARRIWAEPPHPNHVAWFAFVGGSVVFGVGVVLAVTLLVGASLAATVLVVLLGGCGAVAVARYGPEYRYLAGRRADREQEIAGPRAGSSSGQPAPPAFTAEITRLVELRFAEAPVDPAHAVQFAAEVAGVRAGLRDDLVDLYGHDIPAARVAGLDWLVRWHAEQTALAWRSRALYDFRGRLRPAGRSVLLLCAGMVALTLGALLALVVLAGTSVTGALGGVVLLGFGGRLLVAGRMIIYTEDHRNRDDDAEYSRRFQQECAAYQRWWDYLRDQPTDAEMARWLDYDKDHLIDAAMGTYGLTSRQVLAQFVLAEPAPGCRRARVPSGPWRCSAYLAQVFLLTDGGVRQVVLHLNFVNGALNGERRTTFRYDAIASVRVEESSVRPHGRRQVATVEGGGPDDGKPRPILRHRLRLTLVNGRPIDIAANYDDLLPEEGREDADMLRQLAQDTSGVVTALRFLESVAAEGRAWASRRRPR